MNKHLYLCHLLVLSSPTLMRHGHTNLKFASAKQAKEIFDFKNLKRILHKITAAIWFNKSCRSKPLTPTHFSRINHLTPNGHYMGRTAQLTSRCCILCIYSTNIRTEYFKHAA